MSHIITTKTKLVSKVQLTEVAYEFKYTIPDGFEFSPGQFVVLITTPPYRRAYSIVEIKDGLLTLLIDVGPGGPASKYFINTQVGDETTLFGPYGIFKVKETKFNKVFICTGTGVAPLISMAEKIMNPYNDLQKELYGDISVDFLFGARYLKNDIGYKYFEKFKGRKNFRYIRCITRDEDGTGDFKKGRVTDVIPELNYDMENTEFYICAGQEVVDNVASLLKSLGADKIYFEKY